MAEIKTRLEYKEFKNLLHMFTSSSIEDFFLAISMYKGCKGNITLNTIIARRIGKGEYKDEREMHKRLVEFTAVFNTFNLDTAFHKLINQMVEEAENDELSNKLIREEVVNTVNTLIDYHNLLKIVKVEEKNIKI
mgnify:FL=1